LVGTSTFLLCQAEKRIQINIFNQSVDTFSHRGPMRSNGPKFDSLLTITLRGGPGNTTVLTLVHERLEDLAGAMPQVADKVQLGWQLVLEKLQATVAVARS